MLLINGVLNFEGEFGFLSTFVFFMVVLGMVLPSLLSARSMISAAELGEGRAVTAEQFFFKATLAFFL